MSLRLEASIYNFISGPTVIKDEASLRLLVLVTQILVIGWIIKQHCEYRRRSWFEGKERNNLA